MKHGDNDLFIAINNLHFMQTNVLLYISELHSIREHLIWFFYFPIFLHFSIYFLILSKLTIFKFQ